MVSRRDLVVFELTAAASKARCVSSGDNLQELSVPFFHRLRPSNIHSRRICCYIRYAPNHTFLVVHYLPSFTSTVYAERIECVVQRRAMPFFLSINLRDMANREDRRWMRLYMAHYQWIETTMNTPQGRSMRTYSFPWNKALLLLSLCQRRKLVNTGVSYLFHHNSTHVSFTIYIDFHRVP